MLSGSCGEVHISCAGSHQLISGSSDPACHNAAGELHLTERPARADRLYGDVALPRDFCVQGDEVVLAVHLDAVTGVVEQAHGILACRFERLAKDWEKTIASAEAWITIAHIRLGTRRLARYCYVS